MSSGLGKTLQAIVLARYKKEHRGLKHCLIVCGVNSLKYNWEREIKKFCKYEKSIILGSKLNSKGKPVNITIDETKQQIDACPEEFFWIINIEKMRIGKNDTDTIIDHFNQQIAKKNLGMLIFDEAHKSKAIDSAQSRGMLALDKSLDKMLMTGTLLVNNPYDLFCPMSLCGLISYNKWKYEEKFVIKDVWHRPVGYKNMIELQNILYKSSLRRTKDLLDLPEKLYKQEWLECSKDEQWALEEVYNAGYDRYVADLDKIDNPIEIMAKLTRIRQITVAGELVTSKITSSTKFNRLNDILEEAKFNNQKVLVFCPFTEALELGLKYCKEYEPKLVKGGMGTKIQEVVDAHEQADGFSVLFAQEATLGVGYTLTNTSIVVFLSPPWNRANYDQCADRCHRIGQKHTVQIIDLLIKDTYDEMIYTQLHGKGAMADWLIDGKEDEAIKKYLSDAKVVFKEGEAKVESDTLFKIK